MHAMEALSPVVEADDCLIRRILNGEHALYELLMRRYNQRLYRVALSIVGSHDEAEDILQEAFVHAWLRLSQFAGEAKFSTWMTRIVIREAWAHTGRNRRRARIAQNSGALLRAPAPNPETLSMQHELESLLDSAIRSLRPRHRTVLVLRDIEGLTTAETAECLGVSEENVKIRLHRARKILQETLQFRVEPFSSSLFRFDGDRCERIRRSVFRRIHSL